MEHGIDYVVSMRGFNALTQGENDIIDMLVNNVNRLKGNKVMAFKKTRGYVVINKFKLKTLNSLIELSIAFIEKLIALDVVKSIGKSLLEQIFRDHVPMGMVETFLHALHLIAERYQDREEELADVVLKYISNILPVAQMYRDAEKFIKEGSATIGQS